MNACPALRALFASTRSAIKVVVTPVNSALKNAWRVNA